jgi:hypothetical protein
MAIITGERIQNLAHIYIGFNEDFRWNPTISIQTNKHKFLMDFLNGEEYDNPPIVFCYGHLIHKFANYIHLFKNPFVFITHNSDENIQDGLSIRKILASDRIIRVYSQNICFPLSQYPKLYFLPIGIANSQWPHGNLSQLSDVMTRNIPKTKHIYMSFKIDTNSSLRNPCYQSLYQLIPFLPFVNFHENILRMAEYTYCICPNGNGVDTHRMWEALYLNVVPILLENEFSKNIRTMGYPCILVESWETWNPDLLEKNRDYSSEFASAQSLLSMNRIYDLLLQDVRFL